MPLNSQWFAAISEKLLERTGLLEEIGLSNILETTTEEKYS